MTRKPMPLPEGVEVISLDDPAKLHRAIARAVGEGADEQATIVRRPPPRKPDHLRALAMLEGCPTGATEYALAQHGFTRALLDELVRNGDASMTTDKFRSRIGVEDVARFHITDAGRRAQR